jgi:hypothetical protein
VVSIAQVSGQSCGQAPRTIRSAITVDHCAPPNRAQAWRRGRVVRVLGWAFRARTTRTCPLCGSKVDLGKVRCQTCGYKFTGARY